METAVKCSYDMIERRKEDIDQVCREIEELKELQKEFAILVSEQSNQITHIEDVVQSTKNQVDKGRSDIQQAVEHNRSYNRTRNIILLGATGVVLVTTPALGIVSKIGMPLLQAAWTYPNISIPIGALLTLKLI